VNCLLGCIFTWSGSSSYVNNPVCINVLIEIKKVSIILKKSKNSVLAFNKVRCDQEGLFELAI
jgi:hypothetical protein